MVSYYYSSRCCGVNSGNWSKSGYFQWAMGRLWHVSVTDLGQDGTSIKINITLIRYDTKSTWIVYWIKKNRKKPFPLNEDLRVNITVDYFTSQHQYRNDSL